MKLNTPRFDDFWWDKAKPDRRNKAVLKQAIATVLYAKKTVPFYSRHYQDLTEEDIKKIKTLEEFALKVPYITKEHLSMNHPMDFVPRNKINKKHPMNGKFWRYGTGGTTGKPALVMHSMRDWRGMAITANRHIEWDFYKDKAIGDRFNFKKGVLNKRGVISRLTPLNNSRILGAYNADHITNNIYATMLQGLGADFHGRPSASPSIEDIYDSCQKFQVNGVLAPPEGDNIKKGAFLRDLLEMDARSKGNWDLSNKHNPDFQFIFWSSMPISKGLLGYLIDDLKIPYVKGHFGSTEVAPTASTCSHHMRSFHLVYGHSLMLIKSIEKEGLAEPDELGYTIVSKIGASNVNGDNVLPSGMVFLNYMTGDGARLSEDGIKCKCGRNTPVMYDIQRLEFHQGKALHGCQVN